MGDPRTYYISYIIVISIILLVACRAGRSGVVYIESLGIFPFLVFVCLSFVFSLSFSVCFFFLFAVFFVLFLVLSVSFFFFLGGLEAGAVPGESRVVSGLYPGSLGTIPGESREASGPSGPPPVAKYRKNLPFY